MNVYQHPLDTPPRKPARHSQCEKILRVLQQGPATAAQIHRIAGYSRLNSRVAELRKRGYLISCEYVGGKGAEAYRYELHESAESDLAPTVPPLSQDQQPLADPPAVASDSAEQLVLT